MGPQEGLRATSMCAYVFCVSKVMEVGVYAEVCVLCTDAHIAIHTLRCVSMCIRNALWWVYLPLTFLIYPEAIRSPTATPWRLL